MLHARVDTPDGPRIVRADGTEPPPRDAAAPVLHLLLKLFLDCEAWHACPSPRVRCDLSVLSPPGLAMPAELVVRQPLPNRRFLVAGTEESRYGVMVPLPKPLPDEVVVRCSWCLTDPREADLIRDEGGEDSAAVEHVLRLRLRPSGRGQVFTTDVSAWPRDSDGAPPCDRTPFAVLSERVLPDARWPGITVEWDAAGGPLRLDERLDLPGVLLSDIYGFEEFAAEQLHEVAHTASFDPASADTVAHRRNVSVEMPREVLVEAVTLARGVPYGRGSAFTGSMAATEHHPALLKLCGWWNSHASDPACRRAGLCDVVVRIRDDGEYHAAYYETPSVPVAAWGGSPETRACVGDVVLVTFLLGQHSATFDQDGCMLRDVAGQGWQTVGVSEEDVRSGECDEGWYTLQGLAAFPERFPAAWAWLNTPAEPPPAPSRERFEQARLRSRLARGVACARRAFHTVTARRP